MTSESKPSGETVDADRRDSAMPHSPDRPPTPEEERAAEKHKLDPKVAKEHREANERGADVRGEGQITE